MDFSGKLGEKAKVCFCNLCFREIGGEEERERERERDECSFERDKNNIDGNKRRESMREYWWERMRETNDRLKETNNIDRNER